MFLLWFLCGILFIIVLLLYIKVLTLKNSMEEICAELKEHLSEETNTLISISSTDKHTRKIAAELNRQLRLLRKQRWQCQIGNKELSEAVTNISHDLRTPLTAICGYLDLFEDTEKSETVCRYVDAIRNRTHIMKHLTEELFRYSIIASSENKPEFEPVNINSVLEESIAGFYALLQERNIVPCIHMPDIKVIRKLNKAALSRVFANLLNNAIAYSDGDLDITLTKAGEVIFINTASKLSEVQVGQLFDRFYTVETARKSTGLGLAITRTLVEQMNGTISAEYENNQLCISILWQNNSN